jgi:hypothetical protein
MSFILDFVLGLVGDSAVARLGKDDLAEFDCSLRVIAGRQEGLSDGWHDGQASVYPGGLGSEASFHAEDGLRAVLRTSSPISVTVCAVSTAGQRRPNDEEAGKVEPGSQIVELATDTATLEWAVPAKKLKAALERVQSSWPSEVPAAGVED